MVEVADLMFSVELAVLEVVNYLKNAFRILVTIIRMFYTQNLD